MYEFFKFFSSYYYQVTSHRLCNFLEPKIRNALIPVNFAFSLILEPKTSSFGIYSL